VILGRTTEKYRSYCALLKNGVHNEGVAGQVAFLSEVPPHKVADWYAALDLYVAPQRWEGFGLTPLEAMACGVPVVATTVGAFPEVVSTGVGRLVPSGNVELMTEAINEIIENSALRVGLSTAARAQVECRFALEGEARAIMGVYRSLLG